MYQIGSITHKIVTSVWSNRTLNRIWLLENSIYPKLMGYNKVAKGVGISICALISSPNDSETRKARILRVYKSMRSEAAIFQQQSQLLTGQQRSSAHHFSTLRCCIQQPTAFNKINALAESMQGSGLICKFWKWKLEFFIFFLIDPANLQFLINPI